MPNHNCPFQPEQSFFFLDSRNCADTVSALYGYCIIDGVICNRYEDLSGRQPTGAGAYVLITAEDGQITVQQDIIGCYGLYLYRKDGYFALSNSLMYLAQQLPAQYPLSVDQDYASAFLVTDLCSHAMGKTMFQEIEWLNRAVTVHIHTGGKTLSLEYIDYLENTVPIDSQEGIALLDRWYGKWTAFVRSLYACTPHLSMDLSGGFDSRLTLALFLGAGVDMDRIFVYSIEDDLHTHSEDFRIASQISSHFGFPLNNRDHLLPNAENVLPYTLEDSLNISAYLKMGLHKQFHWRSYYYLSPFFHFTGGAGACIRSYWNQAQEAFVDAKLKYVEQYGMADEAFLQSATRRVLDDSYRRMGDKFLRLGRPLTDEELTVARYRETRLTNHFGKSVVEALFGNIYELSPLIDPDLYRLTLEGQGCGDRNLLVAVILDRYAPQLLDFPFEGGRSIAEETIRYAHALNQRFPFAPGSSATQPRQNLAQLQLSARGQKTGWEGRYEELDQVITAAYHADPVRDSFSGYYSPALYTRMDMGVRETAFNPLQNAQVMLAVTCAAEYAQRPEVIRHESLGAHLLRYAALPRRQRYESLCAVPGSELSQVLMVIAQYEDRREGTLSPEWVDSSAYMRLSSGIPSGFLVRSTAGTCRFRFRGSRKGLVKLRIFGCHVIKNASEEFTLPVDLRYVQWNQEVCLDGHRSVRFRANFPVFREIEAGETQEILVRWVPYGTDLQGIPEPLDATRCRVVKDYAKLEKQKAELEQQQAALRQELQSANRQLSRIRSSFWWRLGRMLTFLPRRLKKRSKK